MLRVLLFISLVYAMKILFYKILTAAKNQRYSFILLVCLVLSCPAYAQPPANDDPCNAISLNPTQVCTYQNFTNLNATPSTGIPPPGCASYSGGDVWFKVIVPCTGGIVFDTQTGTITDGGMAVYSGTCGNLVLIECDDDDSPNGLMPYISLSNQVAGSTLWIRVWEYGNDNNGTFGICASIPPPPGPGGNCLNAQPFCTNNVYTFPNATNVPSLGGSGIYTCLLTTPNPVWYYMQVQNPGDIIIGISQVSSSGAGLDVDYALWGPFTSLQLSCPSLSASNNISCSYSPDPTETATILNAQAGQYYILLLTNYANQPGTITFQQTGGTGSTNCGVICNTTAGNNGPVCPGAPLNLVGGTVSNATYSWTGPNCFSSNLQNPTGITAPSVPGTYVYTVTATAPGGTQCNASTTVTVGSSSTATTTTIPTSCAGTNNGSITVSQSAPGNYTYTLTPGNIIQASPVFTGLAAGTYSISFSNGAGCSGLVPNIVVSPGPSLSVTSSTTSPSCPTATNGSITAIPGTPGTYTYTLTPGNVVQNNPLFFNLPAGSYNIQMTNAAGCAGTTASTVNPGLPLTSAFTKSNPVCAGINDGTISFNPAGTAPYSFTLTGPGGPFTQAGLTFNNLGPGTYNYTFSDGSGCTGSGGPITLSTNPALLPGFINSLPLCNGSSNGIISSSASGGVAPYVYSINGGVTYQGPVFSNLVAGSYTIRTKDNAGCIKDSLISLSQPAVLELVTASTNATCNGNDGTITLTATGGTPPFNYSIDNGTTFQASPVFVAPATGPYSTVKVKDTNGCMTGGTVTVNYTDNMFLLMSDSVICAGQSVKLLPQTNPGTSVFSWSPAATLNSGSIQNPVATPLSTTTYTLQATYGPCSRLASLTVTVLNKPVADAGNDKIICFRDSTVLTGSVSNNSGPVLFSWEPTNTVRNPSLPTTIAVPPATQTYVLSIRDNYGCNFLVTDNVTIKVQPPVPAFAGNDTLAVVGVPHQLFGSGGQSYLWSPAAPLDNPLSPQPKATLYNDTKFTVIITDVAGCKGYDTVFIKAYNGPTYYIPNTFTPNGDGLNDIFRAIPPGIVSTEWFRIYNRYGQLIFETNEWLKGWDGTYMGKQQPMGHYVWMIKGKDRNGTNLQMKGTILLIR